MVAYKFIMVMVVFLLIALVWMVTETVTSDLAGVMNNQTTDTATIERNNAAAALYYMVPFIIFIAMFIYILKESGRDNAPAYGGY
jgi:heme/copper-type cytochrome/quinol oxidase subunit 2